ncbi:hypothetical protein PHMEG_00027811 [Phytophthora megakarya]|uniref:Uncharacterized protein n=1 Tax=Phytophthora megakarya TaxID=4795 RepID=A0A225V8Z7_9STRA|nr:hypothetical protein PHMEG_00027811 [Phytophthora megakarya]
MYWNISLSNAFGPSFTKQRISSVKLSATETNTGMCSFVKTVFSPCRVAVGLRMALKS